MHSQGQLTSTQSTNAENQKLHKILIQYFETLNSNYQDNILSDWEMAQQALKIKDGIKIDSWFLLNQNQEIMDAKQTNLLENQDKEVLYQEYWIRVATLFENYKEDYPIFIKAKKETPHLNWDQYLEPLNAAYQVHQISKSLSKNKLPQNIDQYHDLLSSLQDHYESLSQYFPKIGINVILIEQYLTLINEYKSFKSKPIHLIDLLARYCYYTEKETELVFFIHKKASEILNQFSRIQQFPEPIQSMSPITYQNLCEVIQAYNEEKIANEVDLFERTTHLSQVIAKQLAAKKPTANLVSNLDQWSSFKVSDFNLEAASQGLSVVYTASSLKCLYNTVSTYIKNKQEQLHLLQKIQQDVSMTSNTSTQELPQFTKAYLKAQDTQTKATLLKIIKQAIRSPSTTKAYSFFTQIDSLDKTTVESDCLNAFSGFKRY